MDCLVLRNKRSQTNSNQHQREKHTKEKQAMVETTEEAERAHGGMTGRWFSKMNMRQGKEQIERWQTDGEKGKLTKQEYVQTNKKKTRWWATWHGCFAECVQAKTKDDDKQMKLKPHAETTTAKQFHAANTTIIKQNTSDCAWPWVCNHRLIILFDIFIIITQSIRKTRWGWCILSGRFFSFELAKSFWLIEWCLFLLATTK